METTFDFGLQIFKVTGALALVLGIMVAVLYGLRRTGLVNRKQDSSSWIQVIAQQPLGMKHNLILIRVQTQTLLLGVSPQGVRLLSVIPTKSEPDPVETP